jgi:hypothetical protein
MTNIDRRSIEQEGMVISPKQGAGRRDGVIIADRGPWSSNRSRKKTDFREALDALLSNLYHQYARENK